MGATLTDQEYFPVIDFSGFELDPAKASAELFEAACRWGFLILKGHGIPQQEVDEMFSLVCPPYLALSIPLTNASVQDFLRTAQRN